MMMNITNIIFFVLGIFVIAEAIIILIQFDNNKSSKNSSSFSNEQHIAAVNKLKEARKKISELEEENEKLIAEKNSGNESHYKQEYENILKENDNLEKKVANLKNEKFDLEQKVKELTRANDELNRIIVYGSGTKLPITHNADNPTSNKPVSETNDDSVNENQRDSFQTSSQDSVSEEMGGDRNVLKEKFQVESFNGKTMYASFPRLAGNSVYFSDLSENLADDSYFELKVSNELKKATFKPIDFMKIRNYDEAMAAMRTEGAKPNVATTVLEIKPGEAHQEGKDWIIKYFATIKLA